MPDFTLRQMELFCAAARLGSFAAAADEQFLTAPAVATAVNDLERLFGSQLLLRRRAHGVTLTAAGTAMFERGAALIAEANELQLSLSDHAGDLSGPVSLGCYPALSPTILPGLVATFRELYPRVDLRVRDDSMDRLLDLMSRGQLDLALGYRVGLPESVEELVLYETSVHVLLAASHRLALNDAVALEDLADEPLILLDMPPSGAHTLDLLRAAGIRPNVEMRTPNFELVRSFVGRGLGYSILVQKPPIDTSYEGRPVVAKRIAPSPPRESVVAIWPRGVKLTDRARALVDHAAVTVGRQQWTPLSAGG